MATAKPVVSSHLVSTKQYVHFYFRNFTVNSKMGGSKTRPFRLFLIFKWNYTAIRLLSAVYEQSGHPVRTETDRRSMHCNQRYERLSLCNDLGSAEQQSEFLC